ncbi:hypothetical protein ABW07_07890 [Pluralibacter gergoviae]|nr:YdcF family protein [Pluralibacter gergoviae]KMK09181.1 hypothetical protein ABW07_07890 [Pluralibacter gergoviae]
MKKDHPMNTPLQTDTTLRAANRLGQWLAQRDPDSDLSEAGLVILAGNAVIPTIDAACRLAADGRELLISGGIGHSTTYLYDAVARHPRYCAIDTAGRPEAAILADIAHRFWGVPRSRILVEDRSTNCGENARFSLALMAERGLSPGAAAVVQDPTMQRRTIATFSRAQRESGVPTRWLSHPGFAPELLRSGESVPFAPPGDGAWSVERYLSLLLGELPRLRDDAGGYGPRGRDFIVHVEIPEEIDMAWRSLRDDASLRTALACRAL